MGLHGTTQAQIAALFQNKDGDFLDLSGAMSAEQQAFLDKYD